MEKLVALFVSSRKGFFREKACINCSVNCFCACEGANILFDVDSVMKKRLTNIGKGMKVSGSIKVEKGLSTRGNISASLSHNAILGVCYYSGGYIIQFTDLNTNRKIEIKVKDNSLVAFYDNMVILLTTKKTLRETTVENVFKSPTIKIFEKIEEADNVATYTDVSLLNATRILYYPTVYRELFSFNVDTRHINKLFPGKKVDSIASFTGIDCGVKVIFQARMRTRIIGSRTTGYHPAHSYALNMDNTIKMVKKEQGGSLKTVFPLTSKPKNIEDALFKFNDPHSSYLLSLGGKLLPKLNNYYPIVRVYRDVFLAYNESIESWILVRIVTP